MVCSRKDGDKFILERITNYILQNLDSFGDKILIVTFENSPVQINTIKLENYNF